MYLLEAAFKKVMFAIQNIRKINTDFDSVYINNIDDRSLVGKENIFNMIFDQTSNETSYDCEHLGTYSKFNPIETSDNLPDYRKIVIKLKFTKNIQEKLNEYNGQLNIDENFIGLHIRLCDVDILHGNHYEFLSFENFENEVKKIDRDKKIFVSSDNTESLEKLKKEFGDRIYCVDNFIRGKSEKENTFDLQVANFKNSRLWEEAFIEMLLLSKCGTLICRTSNLNNVSVLYSDTIKKIIRL